MLSKSMSLFHSLAHTAGARDGGTYERASSAPSLASDALEMEHEGMCSSERADRPDHHDLHHHIIDMPRDDVPCDLPFDRYVGQQYFHQIDTSFPGLQLINEDPFVFLVHDFLTAAECQELVAMQEQSVRQQPSATGEQQQRNRTSTTVFAPSSEVGWLRARLSRLTKLSEAHLEPTKLTHYREGDFFKPHLDASFQSKKNAWAQRCRTQQLAERGGDELLAAHEPCWWPARCVAVWFYLNDVPEGEGGRTLFTRLQAPGAEYYRQVSSLCRGLGDRDAPPHLGCGSASAALSLVPRAGMAVVSFPATLPRWYGLPDPNTLHEGETAVAPKFIGQQFAWSALIDPEASSVHEHVRDVWRQVLARAAQPGLASRPLGVSPPPADRPPEDLPSAPTRVSNLNFLVGPPDR